MADKTKHLISALTREQFCEVEELLQVGADPNHVLEDRSVSPMHIAAGLGLNYVCLLLQYGGDPNIRVSDGTRPLHVSAVWGYDDAVQILLANGADPFLRDEDGLSPIDLARQGDHKAVVHFLEQYIYILATSDEHTITPKFTYKRLDSDVSQRSLSPIIDVEPEQEQDSIHRDLLDFTCRRRSTVYLHSVQRQVDRAFSDEQKTHVLDVTSPDHPFVEPRYSQTVDEVTSENSPSGNGSLSSDSSLHLRLSVSDIDQSTSDSYVTCDGEDLETMLQKSRLSSGDSDDSDSSGCPDTVVKRNKFFTSLNTNESNNDQSSLNQPINHQPPSSHSSYQHSSHSRPIAQHSSKTSIDSKPKLVLNSQQSLHVLKSSAQGSRDISRDSKPKTLSYTSISSPVDKCKNFLKDHEEHLNFKMASLSNTEHSLRAENVREEFRPGHGKYCKRRPLFSNESQSCEYCDEKLVTTCINESTVCSMCKTLESDLNTLVASKDTSVGNVTVNKVPQKAASMKTSVETKLNKAVHKTVVNKDGKSDIKDRFQSEHNLKDKEKLRENAKYCDLNMDESVISLISCDGNNTEQKCEKAEFHDSDFSTISVPDDYDVDNGLDYLSAWLGASRNKNKKKDSVKGQVSVERSSQSKVGKYPTDENRQLPNEKGDREVILSNNTMVGQRKIHGIFFETDDLKMDKKAQSGFLAGRNEDNDKREKKRLSGILDLNESNARSDSPEMNDLWAEVRLSNQKERKQKARKNMLDTAFCGRESMSSVWSNASTVDYIYTDTENGIALVEHHIPSQCGSTGSRRSLDSLYSVGTHNASHVEVNERDISVSDTSQDTVTYEWREHAMIRSSSVHQDDDESTDDQLASLSQDLLRLDNNTIRTQLRKLGDDPGPVTTTTRQAYLRRLSSLQNDPDQKLLTRQSPEYPPEMTLALKGNLDLSGMAELEMKMVAAFQNPNRLRRWREGTLKSSFTYILLDPRITRDLPNRALSMGDLDVFREFISAIFYVGKGKRARPYCHLYEAIKQMKNPKDKVSKKVQHILDIWGSGLGVVSLHCFQSVIPVEAYTREACMVDAMGLKHLTNMKKGDYYGISTTFSMKHRRTMGVYLLTKSLQIFLAEGERQISPLDIKN